MSSHVFISYGRTDMAYMDRLARHLRAAGIEVWYDYQTDTGASWTKAIKEKVETCAAFIVVMTPEAGESHWVAEEVLMAIRLDKPILPMLLRGEPLFGLSTVEYEDITGEKLPQNSFVEKLRHPESLPRMSAMSRISHPGQASAGWSRRRFLAVAGSGLAVAAIGGSAYWLVGRGDGPGFDGAFPSSTTTTTRAPTASPPSSPSASATPSSTGALDAGGAAGGAGGGAAGVGPDAVGPTAGVGPFLGHTSGVYGVSWSPDGSMIATASADTTARIWNAATGQHIRTLQGHENWVSGVDWRSGRVVTSSFDRTAKIWDAATGQLLRTLTGHSAMLYGAQLSANADRAVTVSDDGTARVWSTASGELLHILSGVDGQVGEAVWSPDSSMIATAGIPTRIYDAATGAEIRTFGGGQPNRVAWSPDGARLAAVDNYIVRVWEVATGVELLTITRHGGRIRAVCWSNDSTRIVTGSEDFTARIWNASTGEELRRFSHNNYIVAVDWAPVGDRIAMSAHDPYARIWTP